MKRTLIVTTLILVLTLAACATASEQVPADVPSPDTGNTALLDQGKNVFKANCSACHTTTSDDVLVGPTMVGLDSRAGSMVDGLDARGYIEQSILEPAAFLNEDFQNLMPNPDGNSLSDEELEAVVEYLLTFK